MDMVKLNKGYAAMRIANNGSPKSSAKWDVFDYVWTG